jgi:hypothetical protein
MVEPTQLGDCNNPPSVWWLERAWLWRVLLQAEVRATPMIMVREFSEVARQARFTEYDHVIKALAAQCVDHALDIGKPAPTVCDNPEAKLRTLVARWHALEY